MKRQSLPSRTASANSSSTWGSNGKTATVHFSHGATGTFGNLTRNALTGPNYWTVDLALSRELGLVSMHTVQLRLEAFNLFNTFNWGIPGTELTAGGWQANFNSGTFGRVTTQAGAPRIIQLGIKYAF